MNCVTTGWQNAGFLSFNQYELTDTHNSQICMQTWPAYGVSKDILCQIKILENHFLYNAGTVWYNVQCWNHFCTFNVNLNIWPRISRRLDL